MLIYFELSMCWFLFFSTLLCPFDLISALLWLIWFFWNLLMVDVDLFRAFLGLRFSLLSFVMPHWFNFSLSIADVIYFEIVRPPLIYFELFIFLFFTTIYAPHNLISSLLTNVIYKFASRVLLFQDALIYRNVIALCYSWQTMVL